MAYREILFRGKVAKKQVSNSLKSIDDIFPDGWVYGFYCPEMCDHPFGKVKPDPHIIATGAPDKILTGMWFEVNEDTVGQYAGIKDAVGDRVFEGDIVQIVYGGLARNGVIEWQSNEARFLIHVKDFCDEWIPIDAVNGVDVIGNIHDNPELLEA